MASSTICSSLTEDILIEIFTYFPLNSIYKLKSLSKVWLSNLSSPYFFINWFKINSKSLPWILYYTTTDKGDVDNLCKSKMAYPELHSGFMSRNQHLFSLNFLINQKPFRGSMNSILLGSSNGLVLFLSSSSDEKPRYHVCNPLNQTWVSLPEPPLRHDLKGLDVNCIICEHSSSFKSYYKVVRIPVFHEPLKKFDVDVFCSHLGVWKSFQVWCGENIVWRSLNFDKVVILNGILSWIEGSHRMVVYNLNQKNQSDIHQCSLINLPDMEFHNADYVNFHSCIGESECWVCYAQPIITATGMTVSVWVLDEGNWKILHKDISIGSVFAEFPSRVGVQIQVLAFNPVDRNDVLLGSKNCVWRFNIQTRSSEEFCLDNRHVQEAGFIFLPFVVKPMPTVLPSPSWIDA